MAAGAMDPVAVQMAWLAAKFTGERINPIRLNPYRRRPKTRQQREVENKEGWAALRAGLKVIAGGR